MLENRAEHNIQALKILLYNHFSEAPCGHFLCNYSSTQLVSDIGAQLGLWVGISIITLAEFLELICGLCCFMDALRRVSVLDRSMKRRADSKVRDNKHIVFSPKRYGKDSQTVLMKAANGDLKHPHAHYHHHRQ